MILAVLAMAFAGCHKEPKAPISGTENGHEWVDLGLPSGLLWATCNVGADTPEEYGDYFAWGETTTKETYNWNTYKYANGGSYENLTKYTGSDGFEVLEASDDAAHVNWGGAWRTPTVDEMRELRDNCIHKWTTQNGVDGHLFVAFNGNTLFLPAAGYRFETELRGAGSYGYIQTSSFSAGTPASAWSLYFYSENYGMGYGSRNSGFTVRPVCTAQD